MNSFTFLGFSLQMFSVLLAVGGSGGLLWALLQTPSRLRPSRFYAGLGVLAGALLGSWGGYIAVHWVYFRAHPETLFQFWLGGLSWAGALAGALLGLAVASWRRQPFGATLNDLLPLFFCLSLVSWLGCWLEGLAYGAQTAAWWGLPAVDEWGQVAARFPLQLLGALFSLGLLWLHAQWRPRLDKCHPGLSASLGLLGLLVLMLVASLLRADPAPAWRGLRLETWAALGGLGLTLVGILVGVLGSRKTQRKVSGPAEDG